MRKMCESRLHAFEYEVDAYRGTAGYTRLYHRFYIHSKSWTPDTKQPLCSTDTQGGAC